MQAIAQRLTFPNALGVVLGILVGWSAIPADASLRHVAHEIRGMDCAPCAYGMQKSLRQLDGVSEVQVSLNEARGTITLRPGNTVTLMEIREVIRQGGFKPMAATVRVAGTLKGEDGRLVLRTESGHEYRLGVSGDAQGLDKRLRELSQGERVLVTAQVPAGKGRVERLQVHDVTELSE